MKKRILFQREGYVWDKVLPTDLRVLGIEMIAGICVGGLQLPGDKVERTCEQIKTHRNPCPERAEISSQKHTHTLLSKGAETAMQSKHTHIHTQVHCHRSTLSLHKNRKDHRALIIKVAAKWKLTWTITLAKLWVTKTEYNETRNIMRWRIWKGHP